MTVFDKTGHGMYGTAWLSMPSVSVGCFTLRVKAELLSHQHHDPSSSNKEINPKKDTARVIMQDHAHKNPRNVVQAMLTLMLSPSILIRRNV
jgi:hypothetical protein